MKTKFLIPFAMLLMVLFSGCDKTDGDCGDDAIESIVIYNSEFFLQPSEIYWGVQGNTRYYTYNWTFANNCTKSNPKVSFIASLFVGNNTLSNPFSFDAGTSTCLGVQSQTAILNPTAGQESYQSGDSEIGMNQCFSGQPSATIYPYITVSFTTLGSSQADSLYLTDNLYFVKATRVYNKPK